MKAAPMHNARISGHIEFRFNPKPVVQFSSSIKITTPAFKYVITVLDAAAVAQHVYAASRINVLFIQ
jgi:hypothetical protein